MPGGVLSFGSTRTSNCPQGKQMSAYTMVGPAGIALLATALLGRGHRPQRSPARPEVPVATARAQVRRLRPWDEPSLQGMCRYQVAGTRQRFVHGEMTWDQVNCGCTAFRTP